jgi:hypothetical protein
VNHDGSGGVMSTFLHATAVECGIPVRRLLGCVCASTVETADMQMYYDHVLEQWRANYEEPMQRLYDRLVSRINRAALYHSRRVKSWKHKSRRMHL